MSNKHGAIRWRWPWIVLPLLLFALLATLGFFVKSYEETNFLRKLEQQALDLAQEIRAGLNRNEQDIRALMGSSGVDHNWNENAKQLLLQHREIVRIELRDHNLRVLREQRSPYAHQPHDYMGRQQAYSEVQQACNNARRIDDPAYSPSYFWLMSKEFGQEVMEMCIPITLANGKKEGFLIASYILADVLSELTSSVNMRDIRASLTEADGTRLTMTGKINRRGEVVRVKQLLDLPGAPFVLMIERGREAGMWLPNALTSTVMALILALTAVLSLMARDMRKRQLAESKLAEALAFRKAMEDSLLTGLRARDMEGRITYVNPAFCKLVGLTAEELIGSSFPALYWPTDRINEFQHRQSVRLAGQVLPQQGFEAEFIRPDGTRVPTLIVEAPLIDAHGQQTGWMSAVVDLSEQRKMEELTRATQERLQATTRLTMIGEMASLISHELNQPLAAIASYASGSLNLLQDQNLNAETTKSDLREAIQRIASQAERAGKVIKSVGDLVRRRERARTMVAPETLLESIAPLVQLQARKLGIDLHTQMDPNGPPVWCDPIMIEQVLLNLIRNGFQAMPMGDPAIESGLRKLEIKVQTVHDPANPHVGQVEFSITDHGHGMTDEVAKRLFTPFFTTKSEGMGLGLSLCRTVIEQHSGALGYRAAAPCGTEFWFTLPTNVSSNTP